MSTRTIFVLAAILQLAASAAHADSTNLMIGYATGDLPAAKSAGFDYAEVRIRDFMRYPDTVFTQFAVSSRSNGLPLVTGNLFLPPELKVVGPGVKLDAVTNYLIKALDRCQTLGVTKIVWGSGESRRAPEGFAGEQAFDQLVTLAKFLAPEAKKRGIIVVVEPVRKAESNTINTAAEGLRWVEAVNHPNFQLLVDIFHLTEENEDAAILVKAGPHLRHIHMANPRGRVFPLSAEEFDYAPFFAALKKIGYHGTMTIEAKTEQLSDEGPRAIKFLRAAMEK